MGAQSLAALKATNKDFNNVLDSFVNKTDVAAGTIAADIKALSSNYIRFVTGDYFGLAVATKSDANSRGGLTYAADTLTENAVDGSTGGSAITLPAATLGTLVVHRFTGVADGGQSIVFSAAGTDTFAAQTLNTDVRDLGDAVVGRRVIGTDLTQTVATFGGAIVTITALHNTFTIAMTATNNQTNKGAELSFFCHEAGKWRLAFLPSELGNGALNATFAGSTV